MTTTLRPLADRVLVKIIPRDEKTAGGLFIPQSATDSRPVTHAVILAVGPGRILEDGRRIEPHVKAGDTVLISKYNGAEIVHEGARCLMCREDDLLGVVEG
jgi:chaperonin GroES